MERYNRKSEGEHLKDVNLNCETCLIEYLEGNYGNFYLGMVESDHLPFNFTIDRSYWFTSIQAHIELKTNSFVSMRIHIQINSNNSLNK
ncbi:CLUMA_CG010190, isoform A [Clunio marinus]|uniref:CLUMA_CG010190, isoform A n=1 Tax=Clunio marinus TaxID=568069 RepID=A0A1J1I9B4_9DIPT|nr:CLUMA_CG010190, isoform A [Clunio marinus]